MMRKTPHPAAITIGGLIQIGFVLSVISGARFLLAGFAAIAEYFVGGGS